ncbi:MAG: hypothetical protein WCP46_09370, partial [Alphaproteobacteria bacterium]
TGPTTVTTLNDNGSVIGINQSSTGATSITVINELLAQGAKVQAYDPAAEKTMQFVFPMTILFCYLES